MAPKLTKVPKWIGDLSKKIFRKIGVFVKKLSWNERLASTSMREKSLKNLGWFLEISLRELRENPL